MGGATARFDTGAVLGRGEKAMTEKIYNWSRSLLCVCGRVEAAVSVRRVCYTVLSVNLLFAKKRKKM